MMPFKTNFAQKCVSAESLLNVLGKYFPSVIVLCCFSLVYFGFLCLWQKSSAHAVPDSHVNTNIIDEELRSKIEENARLHKQVK